MIKEWIQSILKPVIAQAYEEGYKKGADDIVHRMAYIYDACREIGKADGYAEASAINLEEIDSDTFDRLVEENLI